MNSAKLEYINFCKSHDSSINIFHKSWWLDSVCGKQNWDVAIYKKDNEIIAALPFYTKKKFGYKLIIQPPFTQKLGYFFSKEEYKIFYEKNSKEYRKIIFELINQLPNFDYFNQSFFSEVKNWLPFYWNGFDQKTFYSYKIKNIKEKDTMKIFSSGKLTDLKKAKKKFNVKMNAVSAEEFSNHHKASLRKKRDKPFYTLTTLKKLIDAISKNKSGYILSAEDKDSGEIGALILIVYDKYDSYNLITSISSKYRSYAPLTLLFYNSIEESKKYSINYDFEGGMDIKIGDSYRHLGGEPITYFNIKKNNSLFLQFAVLIINFFKINKLSLIK